MIGAQSWKQNINKGQTPYFFAKSELGPNQFLDLLKAKTIIVLGQTKIQIEIVKRTAIFVQIIQYFIKKVYVKRYQFR